MEFAPVIAINFMRYKLFLHFSGLSRGCEYPLNSPITTVDPGSILNQVKPNTITIGIHSFRSGRSVIKRASSVCD